MKILKTILTFLLMVVLACIVVFVPQFISGQKEEDILSETTSRIHSVGSRPKLTSEQVARLYYNREVVENYGPMNTYKSSSAYETYVKELIEMLFEEDDEVSNYIIELLDESLDDRGFSIARGSALIKIDNQPVALNFVHCSVANLEIFYEEKTKTILRANFGFFDENFTNDKDFISFGSNIEDMISKYYENKLGLLKDEYYVISRFEQLGESEEQDYLYIDFGILQYDDIEAKEMYSY